MASIDRLPEGLFGFDTGGELGALIRAKDWASTPLGPIETWPRSLTIGLRIMLTSRYAMWVGWGPELFFFYNDAYRHMSLGDKHPWALGCPAREVWSEIWEDIRSRADVVLQTGAATWDEALPLFLERSGFTEETYHTFSYSPMPDDAGGIGGLFCVVTEDTERVIGQRRLSLVRQLAAELSSTKTEPEVVSAVVASLATDAKDLPFTLTYLFDADGQRARLVAASGVDGEGPVAPRVIPLDEPTGGWPIRDMLERGAVITVDELEARFGPPPRGLWEAPPHQAVLAPIAKQGQDRPAGVLIAGLNPYRPFDAPYRGFIELLAGQIAAGIANARAYEDERRRAEALAEIDRAKTAFFSNVSHELRTPLSLILGPVEDMLTGDGEPLPPGHHERISLVHRNGQRLLKLVNNLLDFSRIEAGRIEASYVPTELATFTADLASVFRSAVERAGLRLVIDAEPVGEPVHVDRDMWEKIVLNLVSNAFKYTLEGEIEVRLRRVGDEVELTVRDTGIGIPADELPKVFQRFHRVAGARGRTQEGTGIGLALVQELAKLHAGRVSVSSVPDRGSTFTVTIPCGTAHLPADRLGGRRLLASSTTAASAFVEEALRWLPSDVPPAPEGAPEAAPEGGPAVRSGEGARPRILLADDNADMRDYVRRLLDERYEVVTVADGEAALAATREQRPELVLTDVMMPRLDGFGLLRRLREDPATVSIPVIMLSARAGEEARVDGLNAGADDYLIKPFSARELLARVGGTLALSRARHEALQRLQALNAAAIAISSALSIHETMQVVADRVRHIIGAHQAMTIYAPGTGWAQAVRASSFTERYASWRGIRSDSGPTWLEELVCGDNVVVRLSTEEVEARAVREELPTDRPPLRGWLAAPLVARDGRNLGLIQLSDKLDGEFNRSDEAMLVQLARTASVAIENVQLYQATKEARADAEAANQMKDQFLATLSHELRTPLNAILGWARILLSGRADASTVKEGLETIDRNSRIQTQLIDELLDISRIISGKLRLEVQRVDLSDVIEASLVAVRPAAEAKSIRIHSVLDPLAGHVSGDPARLQQIVWNLLSNAVKFTPKGGRIQVVLERVNSHVELSVTDTGIGIKPEFLPYVFDRFRQSDASATKRRHGGLGLGLSIVKQLVEMHGGTVRAKSPGEDQGSTFSVALPIVVVHDPAGGPVAPKPARADELQAGSDQLEGIKVLVVDDEPDARALVKRILVGCHAEVETAGSMNEALALLETFQPDVLLSDIGMPEHDGYELIREVRARGWNARRLPAVAFTAFARPEDRRRSLLAGFQIHVSKPVDPEELIAVVATTVGRTGVPT